MSQRIRKFLSATAILIILWLIWNRLRIIIEVHMPWWLLLMLAAAIFLMIDYLLSQIFD